MNILPFPKNKVDFVLYHGNCSDGFGSAFVVWHYYDINNLKMPEFIACKHTTEEPFNKEFLDKLTGKNVFMCDFSYKYQYLEKIIGAASSFMILDHHKSAKLDLESVPDHQKIFRMDKSGCGIVWDFYFEDKPLPKFLAHIQDRDIWEFKLADTENFTTYFYEEKFDFELWREYLDENKVQDAINCGKSWISYKDIVIDNIIRNSRWIVQKIDNNYVIIVYSNSSIFKSEIGSRLFSKYPFADFSCVWDYKLGIDKTIYSLRSTDNRYDVSLISKKFGGGGHRNAAGLELSGLVNPLPFDTLDMEDLNIFFKDDNVTGKITLGKLDHNYVLFEVNAFNDKWIEPNCFNLIKRKNIKSNLIVFKLPTDKVTITGEGDSIEVHKIYEYNIYFNEQSITDDIKQLQHQILCEKDLVIGFENYLSFEEIFTLEKTVVEPIIDSDDEIIEVEEDEEEDDEKEDEDEEDDNVIED